LIYLSPITNKEERIMNRRFTQKVLGSLALGASLAAGLSTPAFAQTYPSKPVAMIVPFTAGGPTDRVARSLAEVMRKSLGQQVIIENVGGAGGTVGTGRVARAAPDGHTVLLMHIGFSTSQSLYRKLPYNPVTDLIPVGGVVDVPMTLIARPNFPANSLPEFLAYIRANKDKMNVANAGLGSASHLCGLMLQSAMQTEFQSIPFKGTADAITALLGGQVDFLCDQTTNTTAQINGGRVKAYAVTSRNRLPSLPNIQTMAEGGFANFEIGIWHGVWVPRGTPPAVIEKLNSSLQASLKDPVFLKQMGELGANIISPDRQSPSGFGAYVTTETTKWAGVIKKAGVYAD